MTTSDSHIEQAYEIARQRYAHLGVDTEQALRRMADISISLHCWQGDDVGGFESEQGLSGGGIQATGNYPGRARNADELRADLDKVYSLLPGTHRLNLHAIYAETGGKKVERDELGPEHFAAWVDWAKQGGHGMDFNPTCFSHPLADDGFTLASLNAETRAFWIRHVQACRRIAEHMGRELGSVSVNNVWIPDGYKDLPADRLAHRALLRESLDACFAEPLDPAAMRDAVESKLFGIGSETYVVGSHEFYLAYAVRNGKMLCLDTGHFHPTETVSDKISSTLLFLDEILLHVSRGVRWDSDHVVLLSNELLDIAQEIVRGDFLARTHIGLDFFDASINRIAAWAIGARAMLKALLYALLEPSMTLRELERNGDYTARLALIEELKTMPFAAVWDRHCEQQGAPVSTRWLDEVKNYEERVLAKRV